MDKTDTNSIAATSAYFLFATFQIYLMKFVSNIDLLLFPYLLE